MHVEAYDYHRGIDGFLHSGFLLDAKDLIVLFDQEGRELLGSGFTAPFPEIGFTEAHKKEIEEFLHTVRMEGSEHIITVIADRDEKPRLMDMTGSRGEGPDEVRVQLWDIPDIEENCFFYRDNMWKYRAMIGMTNLIFFDYDLNHDVICFFRYVTKKSVRLFYGSFGDFELAIREGMEEDEKNEALISQLLTQLANGENTLETTVKTGFLHDKGKVQSLHFKAKYDDMFGHRYMYGVVTNLSEGEEDIPFYMTTAGMDSATGLLSKRSLIEYSEDILGNTATSSRMHYMVLLDIDNFKDINDHYGHLAGDKAIQLLARTLFDVVTDFGIIGRFGGDEFYILTDRVENEERLRSILRNIRGTAELRAKEELGMDDFTLSMGVSQYPDHGRTFKELLDIADKCLYIAKERGKNRYIIYRPQMHEQIQVGLERRNISSYEEQSRVLNQTVHSLFVEGRAAIERALPEIVRGFDLDGIDIYYGPDLERIYTEGKYPVDLDARMFTQNQRYMSGFDEGGVLVLHNYNDLKRPLPQIYAELSECSCMTMIQLVRPSTTAPEYLITFRMMNRVHKWSDAEIGSLSLLGTLIYEVLNRKK